MPDENEKTQPWFRRYYGLGFVSALTVLAWGVVLAVTHIPGLRGGPNGNIEFFFGIGCVALGGIGLLVLWRRSKRAK